MDLFDLTGKRALITGGTHGLGMAMAKGLAMAGAELIINGTTPAKMEAAIKEYRDAGFKAHPSLFDVTDSKAAEQFVDRIEKEIGPIDILVNNAALMKRVPLVDMDPADFRKIIDVDLVGPFIMSKHVGKRMISRKAGKIINICSMMSELGRDTISAYAAAKGGLKMLTRNMAT